ncbi:TPA: hypothetical protein N0F65_007942 [Lagenidium giganteum]|uniref:Glycoside hydrolase 123 catalytic domain-containing protein n=1 Tax=Lagenidium giganteum TaxID=4803 RepID=A0AAV2YEJ9_9STRA|nr:TPA: hypothetical protein N0F65_007942 [Lagenidium giganteum]
MSSQQGMNDNDASSRSSSAIDNASLEVNMEDQGAKDEPDASMSNDESMSSTSSLEIEEAARALDTDAIFLAVHDQHQAQHGPSSPHPSVASSSYDSLQHLFQLAPEAPNSGFEGITRRTASFTDMLPAQLDMRLLPHPRSFSLNFAALEGLASPLQGSPLASLSQLQAPLSPATAAKKRKRQGLWLKAHLLPAMSKAIRSTAAPDPSRMEDVQDSHKDSDDEQDDEGEHGGTSGNGQAQATRRSRPASKRRVTWASIDDHFTDPNGFRLLMARNEVNGVQLHLASNEPFLLSTDVANWLPPQGHVPRARVDVDTAYVPPQLQVEVFIIGYVEDENNQLTTEYLDPQGWSTNVALEHYVYIRVRVQGSVPDGVYELPVRVYTQAAGFCDEVLSWTSSVQVRVMTVVLPLPHEWTFHMDLWQHLSSIARGHGVALWSERHFRLIDTYLETLSEIGQRCISIVATEMPWAGQQCYTEDKYPSALFEHAILEVIDVSQGNESVDDNSAASAQNLQIDFTNFDRLLGLAKKHHMDAEIEVFGLLSVWRDPANRFDGLVTEARRPLLRRRSSSTSSISGASAAKRSGSIHGSINDIMGAALPEADASDIIGAPAVDGWRIRCYCKQTKSFRYLRRVPEIERFITLFYEHCAALNVVDRVRICADEPHNLGLFYLQMDFFQRLAPGFKVKVAMNNLDFFNYAPAQVVDYVPLLPLVCNDMEVTKRMKEQIQAKGGRFCWYVCCGPPFPNQFVSSPLVEGELVGFLTYFLGLDGFLRWNYCLWPAKPWDSLKWRSPLWKVGDMYFVLPGKDGAPVETLRFESLRFAVQSYELMLLAQQTLEHSQMEQLKADVAQLILRTTDYAEFCHFQERSPQDLYSLDPMDYQWARALILETLANAAVSGTMLPASSVAAGSITSPSTSPRKSSFLNTS